MLILIIHVTVHFSFFVWTVPAEW